MFNIPTLYINLQKRNDRKIHIENVLKDFKSVTRIDAVQSDDGYKGCVQSHIKALQYAKEQGWDEVLIFEDDFEWVNKDKFVYPEIDFDVCLLEALVTKKENVSWNYNRVTEAQHTGGYLIQKKFYDTLIECFQKSYDELCRNYCRENYLDIYWWNLQKKNMFITPTLKIGRQMEDYSDIKKKIMKRY